MLFFLVILLNGCGQEQTPTIKDNNFNSEKYQDLLLHYQYSQILKDVLPELQIEKSDTNLADIYAVIAASRKARFYLQADHFNILLGMDTYNTIEKYKKVRVNRYHHFFSAFYFYLAGEKQQALKLLETFQGQNNSSPWINDTKLIKEMILHNKVIPEKAENQIVSVILKSFPEAEINFTKEWDLFLNSSEKSAWMACPVIQNVTSQNVVGIATQLSQLPVNYNEIFSEKIAEISVSSDSLLKLYNQYYNPLLLKNYANFYKVLAQTIYQRIAQDTNASNDLLIQAHYEFVQLLLDFREFTLAKNILTMLLEMRQNTIPEAALQIDTFLCNVALQNKEPNFEERLDAFKNPVIQGYYISKMSDLGYFCNPVVFSRYFHVENMSRSERLTCSEYFGNYYFRKQDYKIAQDYYQRRLLGGSYDIKRNEHLFLLKFIQSLYYNKINADLGIWGVRNLLQEYPELTESEHNFMLIQAGANFK